MSHSSVISVQSIWDPLVSCIWMFIPLSRFKNFITIIVLNIFFVIFPFSSPSGIPTMRILFVLFSHKSHRFSLLFFFFFSFLLLISNVLSSRSLIFFFSMVEYVFEALFGSVIKLSTLEFVWIF